jgi:hypothetical protein
LFLYHGYTMVYRRICSLFVPQCHQTLCRLDKILFVSGSNRYKTNNYKMCLKTPESPLNRAFFYIFLPCLLYFISCLLLYSLYLKENEQFKFVPHSIFGEPMALIYPY